MSALGSSVAEWHDEGPSYLLPVSQFLITFRSKRDYKSKFYFRNLYPATYDRCESNYPNSCSEIDAKAGIRHVSTAVVVTPTRVSKMILQIWFWLVRLLSVFHWIQVGNEIWE